MSGSSAESSTIWNFTAGIRIIPGVLERARWRNTLMWHPHHRISIGIEPLATRLAIDGGHQRLIAEFALQPHQKGA